MNRLKAIALSLAIILTLAFVFNPTQALADQGSGGSGGPQGTTNTNPPPPPPPPPPLWWWLFSAIF